MKFAAENMETTGWFDMDGIGFNASEHVDMEEVYESFEELLNDEILNGIPSDRIILGGFSQGGSVAIYTAFQYGKKLAALFGLSAFVPKRGKVIQVNNVYFVLILMYIVFFLFYDNLFSFRKRGSKGRP